MCRKYTSVSVSSLRSTDYEMIFQVKAKSIINATGPFTDSIRKMDNVESESICSPSTGVHIVLPGYFRYIPPHFTSFRQCFLAQSLLSCYLMNWTKNLNPVYPCQSDEHGTVRPRNIRREDYILSTLGKVHHSRFLSHYV